MDGPFKSDLKAEDLLRMPQASYILGASPKL